MKTLSSTLHRCKQPIPRCHVNKAHEIDRQLKAGVPYLALTGKRMKHKPDLISFRLGRHFRLLYTQNDCGLMVHAIVRRQGLERAIQRR